MTNLEEYRKKIVKDAALERRFPPLTVEEPSMAHTVEILKVYEHTGDSRDLMLKVTDPRLLAQTGGIVQGMSGSPILQDGKLVGAVTHVLIDHADRGYGIFAQRMLEQADRTHSA